MFDIARLFRSARRGASDQTKTPPADESGVKIIAMTQDHEVWDRLRQIADCYNWTLFWAATHDQALILIERYSAPILIYDRDMAGYDWRAELRRLRSYRAAPCILLASTVADPYLWKEVVRNGGFDTITKPFDADRLARVVKCAWSKDWPSSGNGTDHSDRL